MDQMDQDDLDDLDEPFADKELAYRLRVAATLVEEGFHADANYHLQWIYDVMRGQAVLPLLSNPDGLAAYDVCLLRAMLIRW